MGQGNQNSWPIGGRSESGNKEGNTMTESREDAGLRVADALIGGMSAKAQIRNLLPEAIKLLCRVGQQTEESGRIDPDLHAEIAVFVANARHAYENYSEARKAADEISEGTGATISF
jgi:hypothetical protein